MTRRLFRNEDEAYDAKRQRAVDDEQLREIQAKCSHTHTDFGYCMRCGADTIAEPAEIHR